MQICCKMIHSNILSSFLCHNVLKYEWKQIQVDNKMIPSLATSSNLIVHMSKKHEAKGQGIAIMHFGIHIIGHTYTNKVGYQYILAATGSN